MPAAAVIPAPIAYIKVVAVKTLVVGFLSGVTGRPKWIVLVLLLASSKGTRSHLTVWRGSLDFYFEEIRVFTAGYRLEYISRQK